MGPTGVHEHFRGPKVIHGIQKRFQRASWKFQRGFKGVSDDFRGFEEVHRGVLENCRAASRVFKRVLPNIYYFREVLEVSSTFYSVSESFRECGSLKFFKVHQRTSKGIRGSQEVSGAYHKWNFRNLRKNFIGRSRAFQRLFLKFWGLFRGF